MDIGASTKESISAVCMLLVLLIAFPRITLAARFDVAVSAPRALSAHELKEKAREYFEPFKKGAATMSSTINDRATHARWFELRWQLGEAIDAGRPLDGLEEYGVTPDGDGSYSVDLERFPQWRPLGGKMQALFSPGLRASAMEALKERGFRDNDVAVLREYLDSHNPQLDVVAATAHLTESFAAHVKKRAALGHRLDVGELRAFEYQANRSAAEASRAWMVGILNSLDPQRQRILESYLMESRSVMGIAPSDTAGSLDRAENYILSGAYVEAIEQQKRNAKQWSEEAEGLR